MKTKMVVYIIHQYEDCEYGEYYGIYKVYKDKEVAEKEAIKCNVLDATFDYYVEEREVEDE